MCDFILVTSNYIVKHILTINNPTGNGLIYSTDIILGLLLYMSD